jgi:hypothetical protein
MQTKLGDEVGLNDQAAIQTSERDSKTRIWWTVCFSETDLLDQGQGRPGRESGGDSGGNLGINPSSLLVVLVHAEQANRDHQLKGGQEHPNARTD